MEYLNTFDKMYTLLKNSYYILKYSRVSFFHIIKYIFVIKQERKKIVFQLQFMKYNFLKLSKLGKIIKYLKIIKIISIFLSTLPH